MLNLPIADNATTSAFDPRLRREAIWALVVDVVRAVAGRRPLLLWLDNVHAMDEASCALTLAVSRALEHSPALWLCTQRPLSPGAPDPFAEWTGWPGYRELALAGLTNDDVARLVQDRLGGPVRPLALALLQKQAQGNAFYADELAAAMREAGLLVRRADGDWFLSERLFALLQDQHCVWRNPEHGWWALAPDATYSAEALGFPDSVQRTITARLDQLAPEAQLTLKTASVIGPQFEVEILERAHPRRPEREALEGHLAELSQRGLVRAVTARAQPAYEFEHNLVQEGVYDSLLVEQQAELHATVGAALEAVQPEAVEQLAHHFGRARNRDKAPLYLGRAGDKAKRGYVNETALKYYEQALAFEGRWEWRKAQVEVLGVLGQRAQQQTALENLEATPGAPAFEVAYQWGQYYETICDYARAEESMERARSAARERFQSAHEAASLIQLGLIEFRRGRYAPAQTWFEQAQTLFSARANYPAEEARLLAQAANGVGVTQLQQGNYDAARPCFQQALELYHQAGDLRGEAQALSNLGSAAFQQRRFGDALDFHQQALKQRRAIGDRAGQGSSLVNLAQAARDSGDYGQAEVWLQSALQIQRETGNRWDEVNSWNDLGILHQELGKLPEAQVCLQRGLDLSGMIGDTAGAAYVRLNLGLVAFDRGAGEEAEALWKTGLGLARAQQDKALEAMFASYLGVVMLATRHLAEAEQWSALALAMRREGGETLRSVDDLANLALVKWAQGDLSKAGAYARETLAALEGCRSEGPEFPQRDYWACYRVLEAGGEMAEARAALQAGYGWVMARAARITDPELRRSFLENAPRNRQVVDDARRVLGVEGQR